MKLKLSSLLLGGGLILASSFDAESANAQTLPEGVTCSPSATTESAEATCEVFLTPHVSLGFAASGLVDLAEGIGFGIRGNITLRTTVTEMPMSGSIDVWPMDSEIAPYEILGTVNVAPVLPLFPDVSLGAEAEAIVGIVSRETLVELFNTDDYELPLSENYLETANGTLELEQDAYLLFHFASGFNAGVPIGAMLGLNPDAEDPFSVELPESSQTLIFEPTEPYFFIAPDGPDAQDETESDDELYDLQERAEAGLRALLDAGQLEPKERFEAALAEVYRLDAGQLHGLTTDALGGFTGEPEPSVVEGLLQVNLDARKLDRERKGLDDAETQLSPDEMDYSEPRLDEPNKRKGDDDQEEEQDGLPSIKELAISTNGTIPFAPETTWGLPEGVGEFTGHVHVKSTIPLSPGIELEGRIVGYIGEDGVEIGGNGDVRVALEFPPASPAAISFGFDLGQASAGLTLLDTEAATYFSGIKSPDLSWLPPEIPFVPNNTTKIAGYISSLHPEDSVLQAYGEFGFDTSGFSELTGIPLEPLVLSSVLMRLDREGLFAHGRSDVSLHPSLQTGSELDIKTLIGLEDPSKSYITMSGALQIAGIGLDSAIAHVDTRGVTVQGVFATPISQIDLQGSITDRGPALSGAANVTFSLEGVDEAREDALQAVIYAEDRLDALDWEIDDQRAIVEAEREKTIADVQKAARAVNTATSQVNSLQASIDAQKHNIAKFKSQIAAKRRWYNGQPWYKKAGAWVTYASYAAGKSAEIAVAGTKIGALETARATANAALAVAKESLRIAELGLDYSPIESDPRLASLYVARETAVIALAVARETLANIPIPELEVDARIALALNHTGLSGSVDATFNGQRLLGGHIKAGLTPQACITLPGAAEVCAPF